MGTAGSDLVAAATVGTAHRFVDLAALTERLRPNRSRRIRLPRSSTPRL